ncbi:immunity protein Imm33 domain-containing protein [Croceibacterium salegens]
MDNGQAGVCDRFGAEFHPAHPNLKLGLALATLGREPINGLRHPPTGDTTGWYVWAGEKLSTAADFFQSVHADHLNEILPRIVPYLGLAPGWRFQIAPDHEDVWFDASLINAR